MRYSTTITITIDDRHISFVLSVLYQALFIAVLSIFSILKLDQKDPVKAVETLKKLEIKTMKLTQKPKRIRVVRRASQGNSKNRSKNKTVSLDSLLGNLAQKTSSKKSHKKKMVNNLNQKGLDLKNMIDKKSSDSSLKIAGVSNFDDFSFSDVKKAKKVVKDKNKMYVDQEVVRTALSDIRSDYQNCYERALLVDSTLSVTTDFIVNVKKSKIITTKINSKGKGSSKSKMALQNCLIKTTKDLDFGMRSISRKLQYQFMFKQ